MRTSVHYMYYQAVADAKGLRMTEQQRADQLVSRVFGNVHIEYPEVTRELVRTVVQNRRNAGTVNGIVAR